MYFRRWFWRNVSQHITDRRLQIEEWLEFRNYSCLFEALPLQYPIPTHDLALEGRWSKRTMWDNWDGEGKET